MSLTTLMAPETRPQAGCCFKSLWNGRPMITDFHYCSCTLITLCSVCVNMCNYISVYPFMFTCEALQLTWWMNTGCEEVFLPVQKQISVWGNCDPSLSLFHPALLWRLPPGLDSPCYNTTIHHPVKLGRKSQKTIPYPPRPTSKPVLLSP